MIKHLVLTAAEVRDIQRLLRGLTETGTTPEDEDFVRDASLHAGDLPLRLRRSLNDFRLAEADDEAVCRISGYPVDDEKIGPTPSNREDKADTPRTLEEQLLFMLCASLLGEPWTRKRRGPRRP